MSRPYKVIFASDFHTDPCEKLHPAAQLFFKYAADTGADEIIVGGDWMNLKCISKHVERFPGLTEGQTLKLCGDEGHNLLRACKDIASTVTVLEGNHEWWIRNFIYEHHKVRGLFDIESLNGFDKLKANYIPGDAPKYRVGEMYFHHGWCAGENAAALTVKKFGDNICVGHVHTLQVFSMHRERYNDPVVGITAPCLCTLADDRPQSYVWSVQPHKRCHGFIVFYFMDDGRFVYHPILVFKDNKIISPDGRLYTV